MSSEKTCCHGTAGCAGVGGKHWCATVRADSQPGPADVVKRRRRKRKKGGLKEQRSIAKSRALSDRFTHVVHKHMSRGQPESLDSEAMLALVGAGLASFAPSGRFVLHDGDEPVEYTKKEVKRAGENLIADWLLGAFKKVVSP